MITSYGLLRDSVLTTPLVLVVAWVLGGAGAMIATTVACGAVWVWLAISDVAVRRVVRAAVGERQKKQAALQFVATHLSVVPCAALVIYAVGPLPSALGLTVLFLALLQGLVVKTLHDHAPTTTELSC
ncbi:MAG: hypothetical protein ACON4N_04345 [Myxococcota bacterium]